jgi:23S rRNA pseudouridine1911/1915/1917 synthase
MDSDIVSITENEEIDFLPDNKKLDIIFEDDYLLIVNKPSGLIVHPDDKSKNGTLCNIVSNYYFKKGYDLSVKYAHRIDIDTSGIIIFSKDMLTQAYMNNIISTHTLERYYICLASGSFKDKKGTINLPIGEDRHHKSRRRVSKTGQNAITHYEVIKEYNGFSKLLVKLQTGRTHQIRVHMSHIGHPLLGDELYGGSLKKIKRVALHSYLVRFNHPVTGEKIELKKEMPYDLKKILGVD